MIDAVVFLDVFSSKENAFISYFIDKVSNSIGCDIISHVPLMMITNYLGDLEPLHCIYIFNMCTGGTGEQTPNPAMSHSLP